FACEGPGDLVRPFRVLADPEAQVQPVGPVAELEQDVPQRERVLAARDRDQDPVRGLEHVVRLDRALDLLAYVAQEAFGTERRVVTTDLDDGWRLAPPALHPGPRAP